jgi:hypothetical protein
MNVARIKEIISYYDRRINRLSNRLAEEDNIVMQIRLRWAIRNCLPIRQKRSSLGYPAFLMPKIPLNGREGHGRPRATT